MVDRPFNPDNRGNETSKAVGSSSDEKKNEKGLQSQTKWPFASTDAVWPPLSLLALELFACSAILWTTRVSKMNEWKEASEKTYLIRSRSRLCLASVSSLCFSAAAFAAFSASFLAAFWRCFFVCSVLRVWDCDGEGAADEVFMLDPTRSRSASHPKISE